MAATSRALSVTELLEKILLRLPPRDIIASRRVAKFWSATIEASSKLQEAMYLRAALPGARVAVNIPTGAIKAKIPPTVQEKFKRRDTWEETEAVLLNEMLFSKNVSTDRKTFGGRRDKVRRDKLGCFADFEFDVMGCGSADLVRDMFVTNPPVTKVDLFGAFHVSYYFMGARDKTDFWYIEDENGVKVGQVIDKIMGVVSEDKEFVMEESFLVLRGKAVLTEEEKEVMETMGIGGY